MQSNVFPQLMDDINIPKRLFNRYINSKVDKRVSAIKQKELFENREARNTVAHAIMYNVERYENWFQSYFDSNPIHRNPKFQGMKEFYNMDTDTKILSNMDQRKDTLINRPWYCPPAIENNEEEVVKASFARQALLLIDNLNRKKKGFLSDRDYGYQFSEMRLGFATVTFPVSIKISKKKRITSMRTIKDAVVIKSIDNIVPTAFTFDGKRNVYYAGAYGTNPKLIPPENLVYFIRSTYNDKFGSPWGWPLKTGIFPHWVMKKAILAWRLVFLEKFGIPTPIGEVPVGTDPSSDAYIAFDKALGSLMHASKIIKPEGFSVDFLETKSSGSTMDMFQNAINYIDQSISELILGHKQATEATSIGSLASATVKEASLRQAILETDAMDLDTIMSEQVVKFLIDLNFPSNGLYPEHRTHIESDKDIEERISTFKFASESGMTLSETQIRRELHLEYPLGDFDEVSPEEASRVLRYIGKGDTGKEKQQGTNGEAKLSLAQRTKILQELDKKEVNKDELMELLLV